MQDNCSQEPGRQTITACFAFNLDNRRFKMIRKLFSLSLATVFLAGVFGTLAGCNTMAGAGQDIEQGGRAIKNEAREHQDRR